MEDKQHDHDRQVLLQRLLDSVKQCQREFGGKSMLATENTTSVQCLLQNFEDVFQHGLRKNKMMAMINSITEPLRQVTQKMLPEISFWSFIRNHILPHDLEFYEKMDCITTDTGKGRVWLRICLNEHSLDRHTSAILADKSLLMSHYESWALLQDEERSSTLPIIAQGLGSIFFAIDTKSEDLNKQAISKVTAASSHVKVHRRVNSSPLPIIAAFDTEPSILKKINVKKKKKKKVQVASISNLDDFMNPESSQNYSTSVEENMLIYNKIKDRSLSSSSTSKDSTIAFNELINENPSSTVDSVIIVSEMNEKQNERCGDTVENKSINEGDQNLLHDKCIDGTSTTYENLLKKNVVLNHSDNIHGESSVSESGDIIQSSSSDVSFDGIQTTVSSDGDVMFVPYDEEASQAATNTMALLSSVSSQSEVFKTYDAQENKETSVETSQQYLENTTKYQLNDAGNLSTVDLKQAILATAKKKDEVERQNKVLRIALEEEREQNRSLSNENKCLKEQSEQNEMVHKKRLQELTKEIDVLKNQLKKYVAAVQMLKSDKSEESNQALVGLRTSTADDIIIPPPTKERTTSESDSIFEEKLAQMAEMHGELLELQSLLQKQLVSRDNEIARMKKQLIELRGPLPESPLPSFEKGSCDSVYVPHPTLINIWVPSVFLNGKGADAHHLYQIYIRIADEEWNVYRRYSQFSKLHIQVSKLYSCMAKYDFPKKKVFGKKDVKFVQERRRKLQSYLRHLINTCIAKNSDLAQHTNKSELTKLLPFFGEGYHQDEESKSKSSTQKTQSPKYNGL